MRGIGATGSSGFPSSQMSTFRWGVFGTSLISARFVAGLAAAHDANATFIASRSLDRAQRFASVMRVPEARSGYAEAVSTGGIDAAYIATPPSEHAPLAVLCIEAGIPVLVEKPFGGGDADAVKIRNAARVNSVFAMEAMWTRFLPATRTLREHVVSGDIGDVRMVAGSFGSSKEPDHTSSSFDPALGGGAMAQLGVYPVSLAQWLFGAPDQVQATGTIGATGVDEDAAFQMRFRGGVTGAFFATIRAWAPNDFRVMGSHGLIGFAGRLPRPTGIERSRQRPIAADRSPPGRNTRLREHGFTHRIAQLAGVSSRTGTLTTRIGYAGNGYHYQADEVRACIEHGRIESDVMPLDDSVAVALTLDRIRDAIRRGQSA